MDKPKLIRGGANTDERGTISFVNDFNMAEVKRFYVIKHPNLDVERGWRAHRIEQRWFYVTKGTFRISIVKIDNWENPSKTLEREIFDLENHQNLILHVPSGYATCLQACSIDSEVIVFADYGLENAKFDDYLFPTTYFN